MDFKARVLGCLGKVIHWKGQHAIEFFLYHIIIFNLIIWLQNQHQKSKSKDWVHIECILLNEEELVLTRVPSSTMNEFTQNPWNPSPWLLKHSERRKKWRKKHQTWSPMWTSPFTHVNSRCELSLLNRKDHLPNLPHNLEHSGKMRKGCTYHQYIVMKPH